jgi:uncharacterized protein YecE (DUF72 family)
MRFMFQVRDRVAGTDETKSLNASALFIPETSKTVTRVAILIGTASWSLPRAEEEHFPGSGSHLERYAARFAVAEINSSFHRSHRPATWIRWRDSVPESFRFSVKMPKAITHTQGLRDAEALLATFLDEVSVLEKTLGAFLVQLPPKLLFVAEL